VDPFTAVKDVPHDAANKLRLGFELDAVAVAVGPNATQRAFSVARARVRGEDVVAGGCVVVRGGGV